MLTTWLLVSGGMKATVGGVRLQNEPKQALENGEWGGTWGGWKRGSTQFSVVFDAGCQKCDRAVSASGSAGMEE